MRDICIFGSCVTRDVFRISQYLGDLKYFARSSLISLMSDPLFLRDEEIQLDSDFQKKMIISDFSKNFLNAAGTKDTLFIIDLIDERFDLMKYKQSYVTCSNEFVNGKLTDIYPFERISRHQDSTHELWKQSCLLFFNTFLKKYRARI